MTALPPAALPLQSGLAKAIIAALQQAGVTVHAGSGAAASFPDLPAAPSDRHEYSSLDVSVEVAGSMQEAVDHIHK